MAYNFFITVVIVPVFRLFTVCSSIVLFIIPGCIALIMAAVFLLIIFVILSFVSALFCMFRFQELFPVKYGIYGLDCCKI